MLYIIKIIIIIMRLNTGESNNFHMGCQVYSRGKSTLPVFASKTQINIYINYNTCNTLVCMFR